MSRVHACGVSIRPCVPTGRPPPIPAAAGTFPSRFRRKFPASHPGPGRRANYSGRVDRPGEVLVLVVSSAKVVVLLLSAREQQGRRAADRAWNLLIGNLKAGECVPFLGAGACGERIPLGAPMAHRWGDDAHYPMFDKTNLPRVMQYVATTEYNGDLTSLKRDFIARELNAVEPPDFTEPGQIHGLLARFELPLYVTTNYDDFMYLALQQRRKRPRQDHSPWYATGPEHNRDTPFTDSEYEPTAAEPLVFHLHGHYSVPSSLVLTEDDYIEYLVRLAGDSNREAGDDVSSILPAYVHGRLRSKPLLFVGYSLRDWTFLVLFRMLLHGIPNALRRNHISVQVDPMERAPRQARLYLERYLGMQRIQIFWDSAESFARELSARMEDIGS